MRRLRIALMIGSLREGGAERQVIELAKGLTARGHRVVVMTLRPGGAWGSELRDAGIRVIDLNVPILRPWWDVVGKLRAVLALARTVWLLWRFRTDVLHAWLFEAEAWAVLAKGWTAPGHLVTVRVNVGNETRASVWRQSVQNRCNRQAEAVIANAPSIAGRALKSERNLQIQRIRIIRNGIEVSRFEDAVPGDLTREVAGFQQDHLAVICVANLFAYKGHADLLSAWETVQRSHPNANLLLVGRDEGMGPELRRQIAERIPGARVHFLGVRNDVAALLRASDLFVLASHEEGMPNAVIEAMAAGLPVVATHVGGIREAVKPGKTGLLVPPRDPAALAEALLRMLGDDGLRRQFGERGRSRARRRFSMRRLIARHERVYYEVCSRRRMAD